MTSTPHVDKILQVAISEGASDIHLAVGVAPTLRVHGQLRRLETKVLEPEDTASYAKSLAPEQFQLELGEKGSCNFSIDNFKGRSFRVNICKERRGVSLVMRLVPDKILRPEELGLAESVVKAARMDRGLVLVTGATGSGKSTTLASLVDMLAREGGKRIVTVEAPIENRFSHYEHSVVTQREVPIHTQDFSAAIIDALRQDPDVIMVGEMRSYEDMRVAIGAAETGHIVFATLHTNSVSESIGRMVGSFPADEQNLIRTQLSTSLNAIVSQKLVPCSDGQGRVLVHEVLVLNAAVQHLIRDNHPERIPSSIQTGGKDGMVMFDDHLFARVRDGVISREVGMVNARNKPEFAQRLGRLHAED